MKKLFVSSLGVNVLLMVFNLCTGMFVARLLGPLGRGELAIATRWSSLFTMLFTMGLPGAVIYLGKQSRPKQSEYLGMYLVLGTATGLIGLGMGEMLLPYILRNQPHPVVHLAEISMLSVPFGILADGLVGSLQSLNKFRNVLIIQLASGVGALLVITLLVSFREFQVVDYIVGTISWSVMIFLITLTWAAKFVRPKILFHIEPVKHLLTKGIQIYAGSIVNVFGNNLDQLLISLFLSPYNMGLYAVCVSVSTLLPSLVTGTIQTFLWPKLMDMKADERRQSVARIHSGLLYSSLGITLLMGALLPFALPFVYGHQYATAIPIGEVLLTAAPMSVGYMVLVNYMSTLGQFNIVTVAEILGLGLGFCITYPLSHAWGGLGAAVGVVVAASSKWILLIVASNRTVQSSFGLFKPCLGDVIILRDAMSRKLRWMHLGRSTSGRI